MTNLNPACYPPETIRICNMSGTPINQLQSRLMTLYESERFLQQVLTESRTAASDYEKWKALELGARATLMVCDILIVGLEELTSGADPLTRGAGFALSRLYDGTKLVVDAAFSGQLDSSMGYKMIAKNKAKIAELTAKQLRYGKVERTLNLAQQLVGYGEAMWSFVQGTTNGSPGAAGIRSAIRSTENQLETIRNKISEIESELRRCGYDRTNTLLLG